SQPGALHARCHSPLGDAGRTRDPGLVLRARPGRRRHGAMPPRLRRRDLGRPRRRRRGVPAGRAAVESQRAGARRQRARGHEGVGRNAMPPPVRVEHFGIHENHSGTNEVSIEYAALSFVNEENVRYRTRLAGYDAGWSPPVTTTSLRYTNLPAWGVPKEYVFEVMASNNDGVWSAPHRFAFRIRPAWWRTWWAFGAALAALALAVTLLLRQRTRKLAARNRELAMLVAAGTAELQERANELAMLDGVVEAINRETTLDSL